MNNKIVVVLSLLLMITLSISIYNTFKIKNKEQELITNINKNYNYKNEVVSNNDDKSYLGYLEISNLGIKKVISYGTSDNILDQNVLGLHKMSISLDDKVGNIIIAGHNNKYVFGNLYKIKVNDLIKIVTKGNNYLFKVIKKDVVKDDDFRYFILEDKKKIITLITCYGSNKRLFVIGEMI